MKYYSVTEVEMKRYAVLQDVVSGLLTLKAAAELLGEVKSKGVEILLKAVYSPF